MKKREILFCTVALLTVIWALNSAAVAYAADPVALAGDTTGATKQTISEIGEKLDLESVAKTAAATKIGLNYVWV